MADESGFGRDSIATRLATPEEIADAGAATEPSPASREKYEVATTIGEGGMGRVLLVEDRDLGRQVAMKVMKRDLARSPEHRARFVAEAQATSQLEHPGIPPVHDIGVKPTGEVYYTMKLVRGQSLAVVLRELVVGASRARAEYSLHRLISILERVCEAVHFAHEKGVLHRDLKPENIMLGEYGEVHVVDWGLAKVSRSSELPSGDPESEGVSVASEQTTRAGTIKGTVPYMSPEQASGQDLDARSDVYALGCVLYEMVTLRIAFEGAAESLLGRVRRGEFPNVRTRNARRRVPEALAELCDAAMAHDRSDRPSTVDDFRLRLRAWLDGRDDAARRHAEAERLLQLGRQEWARYRQLQADVVAAESRAEEEAAKFETWQPVSEKRSAWLARRRVDELRRDAAMSFAKTTQLLSGALLADDSHRDARNELAGVWRRRLEEAEAANQAPDAAHAEEMLRTYDDGRFTRYVAGTGSLTLTSDPPGAEVLLHRYEERDGVLVSVEARSLGRTPLGPCELPMGSYLCVLRHEGVRDVRYPVHITRNREWIGDVRLLTDEQIGAGYVYVPSGPYRWHSYGEHQDKTLSAFTIQRLPVTFGEYFEFLDWAARSVSLEAARARFPRIRPNEPIIEAVPGGGYQLTDAGRVRLGWRNSEELPVAQALRLPVCQVSRSDAEAYCSWRSEVEGTIVRLPTVDEYQKSGYGVDGRVYPWGDVEESSLANVLGGRPGPPRLLPIGEGWTADAPYDVVDVIGGAAEWTSTDADEPVPTKHAEHGRFVAVFGAPWDSRLHCYEITIQEHSVNAGFRCARSDF